MKDCCRSTQPGPHRSRRSPLWIVFFLVATVGLVAFFSSSFSQAGVQHGDEHGKPAQKAQAMPTSYADAVRAIEARLKRIDSLIASKELEHVHAEAEVIRDVAKSLAQLALKSDSGVPKDAVKEINLTAKALADKFEPIDEAGDSGNLDATKKVYAAMVTLVQTLQKYAPASYQCPMKCEAAKTYAAPGKCPVCDMDLKKLTSDKYSAEVKPVGDAIKPGVPATLAIKLMDPTGKVVKDLQVVHEKIVHLLMVSKDLSWYAHEHPEIQADGSFKLTIAFPAAGEYVLYHDFTPPAVGQQVVQATVTVPGQAPAPVPLKVDTDAAKQVEGYTIKLTTKGPITTGHDTEIVFDIAREGKPITDLEPYLGALGHLVIISQDLKNFVHSHPNDEGEKHERGEGAGHDEGGEEEREEHEKEAAESKGPDVHFHAHFEAPGLYKGWAQFQHKGKVLTVPYVMDVKPGQGDAPKGGGHKH